MSQNQMEVTTTDTGSYLLQLSSAIKNCFKPLWMFMKGLLMFLIGAFYGKLSVVGILVNLLIVPVFSFVYCIAFCLLFSEGLPEFFVNIFIGLQHAFLFAITCLGQTSARYSFLYIDLLQYHHVIRWIVICIVIFALLQVLSRLTKSQ